MKPSFTFVALSALALLFLPGCAGTKPAHPGQTLVGAGFRLRTPETPRQKEIYAKLPAYKVQRLQVDGHTFYVYKDAAKGVAFVGGEGEYQRYRQMAKQESTEGFYNAISADDARDWYSAYSSDWR